MSDSEPKAPAESTDEPASSVADDSEPLRLPHGPVRRNAPLLVGVLLVLVIGPWITQLLTSYRGIVLDVQGEKMLVGFEVQPPKWIEAIEVEHGDMVVKGVGAWESVVAPRAPADHHLVKLYERWMLTYTGTIVRIIDPTRPQGAHTAVVALDGDGGRIHVPLTSSSLDGAAVGRRVEKVPKSWDPGLTNDPVPTPSGSTLPTTEADPVREATLAE